MRCRHLKRLLIRLHELQSMNLSRDGLLLQLGAAKQQAPSAWRLGQVQIAYAMHVTLRRWLHNLAPGLTPRSLLEKFSAVQMIDVHLPTTDGRTVIISRYTQPEPELQVLLDQLKLQLPSPPPPRVTAAAELGNQ